MHFFSLISFKNQVQEILLTVQDGLYPYNIETPLNPSSDTYLTLCSNQSPFDLNTLLSTDAQQGRNWSPLTADNSSIFYPPVDRNSSYTYTV